MGDISPDHNEIRTAKMLHIHATGTPYEIGHTHGIQARTQIAGSISFYTQQFASSARLSWPQVRDHALRFLPSIQAKWPRYLEEMRGIAAGAGVELADILALNVRTEITFGLFSDGCTALSWRVDGGEGGSWLAQNWDWQPAQQENLIALTISQEGKKPEIKMIAEAGLVGKIGLNSAAVGVCLNAIRAKGVDYERIPVHLALRLVLESSSAAEAVAGLSRWGVAAACHILIADGEAGGVGVECSHLDVKTIPMNMRGQVFHSNHFLLQHEPGVEDTVWIPDTLERVKRIEELADAIEGPTVGAKLASLFKDEQGLPGAICRIPNGEAGSGTLFNIVMDLSAKRAEVVVGRPVDPIESFVLEF